MGLPYNAFAYKWVFVANVLKIVACAGSIIFLEGQKAFHCIDGLNFFDCWASNQSLSLKLSNSRRSRWHIDMQKIHLCCITGKNYKIWNSYFLPIVFWNETYWKRCTWISKNRWNDMNEHIEIHVFIFVSILCLTIKVEKIKKFQRQEMKMLIEKQ